MIPVSNKTRSITRVCYTHPNFWRQENTITIILKNHAPAGATLSTFGVRVRPDVKTRWIAESYREEPIETKPAAIRRWSPRRRHHPRHLHRPYRPRPRYLCLIAAPR